MNAKHTPGTWLRDDAPDDRYPCIYAGDLLIAQVFGGKEDQPPVSEAGPNADLIAAAPDLLAVAQNFEIKGPDADGLVWLVLRGKGTTGSAAFNLGFEKRMAAQVALHLEQDRRAAIAKAEGR